MHSPDLPINTFPAAISKEIVENLQREFGSLITPGNFDIIAGGCINHGGVFHTSAGDFFVKWNDRHHFPNMFECEKKGLSSLAATNTVRVPKMIAVGETERYQFIVLEFLKAGKLSNSFWEDLGHQLANLHQKTTASFGLGYDNYIGSIKQYNAPRNSWTSFFIEQRISQQLMMSEKSGLTDHTMRKKFDLLFAKLNTILPENRPALIHGDLWAGNVVADEQGDPCLVDPAIYFGEAEIEIAYTRLFGSFDEGFYLAYNQINPPAPDFEDRMDIYNLYPLLVHTNLFGRSYLDQVDRILNRFI